MPLMCRGGEFIRLWFVNDKASAHNLCHLIALLEQGFKFSSLFCNFRTLPMHQIFSFNRAQERIKDNLWLHPHVAVLFINKHLYLHSAFVVANHLVAAIA